MRERTERAGEKAPYRTCGTDGGSVSERWARLTAQRGVQRGVKYRDLRS